MGQFGNVEGKILKKVLNILGRIIIRENWNYLKILHPFICKVKNTESNLLLILQIPAVL